MTSSVPKTMRAWQFSAVTSTLPAALKFTTSAPLPSTAASLKPNQALVKVHYCALNPVDYKIPEAPLVGRLLSFRKPGIPGYDYCGTLVAAGSNSKNLQPGQLVFGILDTASPGALAEYVVAELNACIAVPEGVKAEDAVTLGVASLTAWQVIVPRLSQKDRWSSAQPKVFINGGSGGVGTFGIQIAKAKGCYVVATCSARNIELCKRLGADEVIDYTKGGVVDALARIANDQGAFDLAANFVDIAGDLYYQAHRYLKPSASYVAIAGSPSLAVMGQMLMAFTLPAFLGGGQRKFEFIGVAPNAEQYAEIARLVQQGLIKPVREEMYEMEDVPRAYERLKTGRVAGKLVVKVT